MHTVHIIRDECPNWHEGNYPPCGCVEDGSETNRQRLATAEQALWQCPSCGARYRTDAPGVKCSLCVTIDVLVQQRDEARAALSSARELLERARLYYGLDGCDCQACAECGKSPVECSKTDCAEGCSCSPCDGCRIKAFLEGTRG